MESSKRDCFDCNVVAVGAYFVLGKLLVDQEGEFMVERIRRILPRSSLTLPTIRKVSFASWFIGGHFLGLYASLWRSFLLEKEKYSRTNDSSTSKSQRSDSTE